MTTFPEVGDPGYNRIVTGRSQIAATRLRMRSLLTFTDTCVMSRLWLVLQAAHTD